MTNEIYQENLRKKIIVGTTIVTSVFVLLFLGSILGRQGATKIEVTEDEIRSSVVEKSPDADIVRQENIDLLSKKMLELLAKNTTAPRPDNAIELFFGSQKMGLQGRAGEKLYASLGLIPQRDPKTDDLYHYFINTDTKKFAFLAFVDDPEKGNNRVGGKAVYAIGEALEDFVVTKDNFPMTTVLPDGEKVDLALNKNRFIKNLDLFSSCQEIKKAFPKIRSGKQTIQNGEQELIVYCDMQTDNGGWTLFYANNGHSNSPINMSYTQMRDILTTNPVNNISEYTNPNLAGLIDTLPLIEKGAKEILIKNRVSDENKWVKMSFNNPRTLKWALSDAVLGKTDIGCLKIPIKGTWSILNQDGTLKHENMTELMNHGGTNWGVSHDNFSCNGFTGSVHPHIAFYNAHGTLAKERARSNDSIGGTWGGENEYRYFIR